MQQESPAPAKQVYMYFRASLFQTRFSSPRKFGVCGASRRGGAGLRRHIFRFAVSCAPSVSTRWSASPLPPRGASLRYLTAHATSHQQTMQHSECKHLFARAALQTALGGRSLGRLEPVSEPVPCNARVRMVAHPHARQSMYPVPCSVYHRTAWSFCWLNEFRAASSLFKVFSLVWTRLSGESGEMPRGSPASHRGRHIYLRAGDQKLSSRDILSSSVVRPCDGLFRSRRRWRDSSRFDLCGCFLQASALGVAGPACTVRSHVRAVA